jgi:protein O-GlcNAc transferase
MAMAGSTEIDNAVALFRAGNAAGAANACRAILRRDKRNGTVLYLLALAEMQQSRFAEAERVFATLVEIEPRAAEVWANRGNNFIAMRHHDRAIDALDRALALEPNFFEALYNRAKLLKDAGRYDEALAGYDRCLVIMPDFADALNNRGTVLAALGRHAEALSSYDRCLALAPGALDTLVNRGNALTALKRHDEALACYDRCLAIAPQAAPALLNRGNLLVTLERYDEALESFEKCIAAAPDDVKARLGAARLLAGQKRFEDAKRFLDRILEIDRDADFVRGYLAYARLMLCDWTGLAEMIAALRERVRSGKAAAMPFDFLHLTDSAAEQLRCTRAYVAEDFRGQAGRAGAARAGGRIRLAYLSADLHDHPVAYLAAGLFELHDREKFETVAISFGPDGAGDMRRRLAAAFGKFIDVRHMDDRAVADLLRSLEIDIAVDLMGFTANNRTGVLASRPAPIQVNYLGHPGTMGADFIDYIIADRYVVPDHLRSAYSENIVHLPDTFQVNDSKRPHPEAAPPRDALGLPADGIVFCAFNNVAKVTPAVFDVWMRLLRQVDGSMLWILAETAVTQRNLRREAQARGVSPERIVPAPRFAPRVGYAGYLAQYGSADIFLDTLPFNGGTTVSDALWAGLPVVTCSGEAFASRMAGSLVAAAGFPELATSSLDEYERLALALATDRPRLAALKAKLAANRETCALFDTDRFRRHIEAAYTEMHRRHLAGEPPASFAVAPVEP